MKEITTTQKTGAPPTGGTAGGGRGPSSSILSRLGVVGMDHLEPVVLAALACESPLLLIGPHGTAKSMLLLRLSEALGLSWRHYNASLLNYDDLVGYPLPDGEGRLRFVETPASIWGAQVVFIDEISRCRPDMQNRLFPIIHEKRVQGMALAQLVHRWAAMNPPASDGDDGDDGYAGSEPLDPALADRFPFVVEVPRWEALSQADRDAVIRARPGPVGPADAAGLARAVARVRDDLATVEQAFGCFLTDYVRLVADSAAKLDLAFSGRRASMLYRNVIAAHAARMLAAPAADPCDSAWLALQCSLPHRAEGRPVDGPRLLVAHNEAWRAAGLDALDPRRLLVSEPDPVRRAVTASFLGGLTSQEYSAYVADALAEAPPGGRHALAAFVLESPGAERLNAAVAAQVAQLTTLIITGQNLCQGTVAASGPHKAWQECEALLAGMPRGDGETVMLGNLFAALTAKGDIARAGDGPTVLAAWRKVRGMCVGRTAGSEGRT